MVKYYEEKSPRGEYVLVIEGAQAENEEIITFDMAVEKVKELINQGVKVWFISGRYSSSTQQRADDLRISGCINGTCGSWIIKSCNSEGHF